MYRSICSQILCLKWFKSPAEEVSTTDNEVSIMDMPDLVMRKILGYVDFITIMNLRKVCHAFRNFIDDTKLDYGLTRVCFVVRPSLIRVIIYRSNPMVSSYTDLITLNHVDPIILNYAKYATSSLVNINGSDRVTFLKEEDFLDVFSRDLRVILRNQRLSSMRLEIKEKDYDLVGSMFYKEFLNRNFTSITNKKYGWWSCCRNRFKSQWEFVNHLHAVNDVHFLKPSVDQFYDCFKTVLKSRSSTPIQIKKLEIQVMESYHLMDIARFIDIKHMKCLDIDRLRLDEDKEQFLDEIVELNGWECIQELTIRNFNINIPLERFLHKSQLNIQIPAISMEDVLFLKMKLLTSPVFENYTIYYDDPKDNMDQLFSILGRSETERVKHWYFRIADTKQVLNIGHRPYNDYFKFSFLRAVICDVPKNAIIY